MPKKIPVSQMREWLQSYEEGKSEASIARDDHCDVRTVKRGIEQARRERDAHVARAELLKDALRKHQDDLMGVVNHMLSALVMSANNLELPRERDAIPLPIQLSAAVARYEIGMGWTIVLHVENSTLWELLQEHLRRDSMWDVLARWRKALTTHIEARVALKRKAAALLEEKTALKVIQDIDKAPKNGLIYPIAVDLFYQVVLNRILGILDGTNPEERIMAMPDGYIELGAGGSRLAYAPNSQKKCREHILEVLKELQKSSKTTDVRDTYGEAEESTAKARRVVEEITLLGLVPGQCRVCRRLGI